LLNKEEKAERWGIGAERGKKAIFVPGGGEKGSDLVHEGEKGGIGAHPFSGRRKKNIS